MTTDISKVYEPAEVEKRIYKLWQDNEAFSPKGEGEPFTIVIPPPNVTGNLHMGHALDNSLQDALIRFHRMLGVPTLWVPGTDHAGIATQNVVERELKKQGKTKEDLGREEFINKVWEWKEKYGGQIINQLKRLGASCDWSRERFTMDEGLSRAVRHEFVSLYKKGLIYRGKRIINWCPRCQTALSDIETEYSQKKGKLWHIKYPLQDGKRFVVVATTRPETMLGDTAVAVNPKDERYHALIGKMIALPLTNRLIPVIKDDFVDASFGTGAVKVTPAHDPNDFEIGIRHNLPQINMLYPDGRVHTKEFDENEKKKTSRYDGLNRFVARDEIVADLEKEGLIEKIEDYDNSVGHCYRCKTVVEPYLSDQWFVAVKDLARPAIQAAEEGKITFVPARWNKVFINWMTNLKDWCISRQLWWGHQIPVWYCDCGEIIVSESDPKACPKCKSSKLTQDPDVFDTWFSSALWPFSVLGWPDNTEELKKHYPTSTLVTGYDIITFWVSRMIMMGMEFMKKEPFKTVYIHGLVRDISGKKMSKSLGNVIDPLDIIDHAGADSLRFALISLITGQGQDIKITEEKIKEARNFSNKLWNVSRFVLMNLDIEEFSLNSQDQLSLWDKWIISRLNEVIDKTYKLIKNHELGDAARLLYDFIWSEYCDWYIEVSKINLNQKGKVESKTTQKVLILVLENILKLLHPFMPFITEEIWQILPTKKEPLLMLSAWSKSENGKIDLNLNQKANKLKEIIRSIRNLRAEISLAHSQKPEVIIVDPSKKYTQIINDSQSVIINLSKLNKITIVNKLDNEPYYSAMSVIEDLEIYMPLEGLIDIKKEYERLQKENEKTEIDLRKILSRLEDEKFMSNAPKEAIDEQQSRKKTLEEKIKMLSQRMRNLSKPSA